VKFSLRFNNDLPVNDYVRLAQVAEAAGFDQFWVSHDLFMRGAFVILTAIAAHTSRIEIGTCVVNPYSMNPAEIAMHAAALDEFCGGRFNLGISAGAGDFLDWIGIIQDKPLTATLEAIHALNALLSGERAASDGQFLHWTNEAYLRFTPRRRIPIYLGAMSPKMLRAVGEVADGGLPLLFPPEHYETVMPYIREGAANIGRDLAAVDVAACIWCSIADDRAAAEDVLRGKIAYYGHALSPLILARLGVDRAEFDPIQRAMMVERDESKAKAMVTDAMLRIGIVGTTHDVIARLETLVSMGARHLSFGPPLGVDPAAAIAALGRDVLPYFRDKGA
jgi:5,10-methylenetetrahydromethanopterin reductase